jgi:dienelactone hydrolase
MPIAGTRVDRVIGRLTHLLHVRPAKENTVADVGPYLDLPPEALFPAPVAPPDVVRRPSLLPRPGRALELLTWRSQHVPLCPRYAKRHTGVYAKNLTASARYTHPHSGPRDRALVYVHGWLEPGPWIEEVLLLPQLYDALGVDVLHVQLPFHGTRNPRSSLFHGEFYWSADLVRSFDAIRQSVLDARTAVAWLRAQGYREIGVTGISLGGSIAMVLACLDPLPDYVVPIVSHLAIGAAVEEAPILWRMRTDLERFGVGRAQREEIFRRFGLEQLTPKLSPERQLWIMAREDAYIAAPLVEAQWRAWGEPPIEWIPGGHMTFPLSLGRIVDRMRAFHASLGATA